MAAKEQKGVAALERALEIMNVFRGSGGEKSLTELSEATQLYKSTILRLCVSLERYGYIIRRPNGNFMLGAILFELGSTFQRSFRLADHVRPALEEIVAGTQESATLWVRDNQYRVCLFRAESPQRIRDAAITEGDRLPLDSGATSTILRAFGTRDWRASRAAPSLIAVSLGGYVKDLGGVSCPVFQREDALLGALTVAGPNSRFSPTEVKRFKAVLFSAAEQLTRTLGGDASPFEKSKNKI